MGSELVGSALITAISSLLAGGMGGLAMGSERRYKERRGRELEEKLKPRMPFFQTPYLAGYDKILMQAIMGNLMEQLGAGRAGSWGINPAETLSQPQQVPGAKILNDRYRSVIG